MSSIAWSIRRLAFCTCVLGLVVAGLPDANAATRGPPWCDDSVVEATDLPRVVPRDMCDLRGVRIEDHGVSVVVGPPGTGIYGEALLGDGDGAEELAVTTLEDGTVVLAHVGEEALEEDNGADASLAPGACSDPQYNHNGIKESHQHQFRINDSTIPSRNNVSKTIDAIRAGGRNITNQYNDCGWADQVSADILYLGTTTRRANLNDGKCVGFTSKDEVNVVDFGFVAKKSNGSIVVGLTCNWYVYNGYNELVESDIRLNATHALFYNTGASCNGEYHVASIMTHERGHTFGMGHAGSGHDNLTMYGVAKKCSRAQETLGNGDMRGLRAIY